MNVINKLRSSLGRRRTAVIVVVSTILLATGAGVFVIVRESSTSKPLNDVQFDALTSGTTFLGQDGQFTPAKLTGAGGQELAECADTEYEINKLQGKHFGAAGDFMWGVFIARTETSEDARGIVLNIAHGSEQCEPKASLGPVNTGSTNSVTWVVNSTTVRNYGLVMAYRNVILVIFDKALAGDPEGSATQFRTLVDRASS